MPKQAIIDLATKEEDRDEMRAHLNKALNLPFIRSGPHGVYIPNGQKAHVEAARYASSFGNVSLVNP